MIWRGVCLVTYRPDTVGRWVRFPPASEVHVPTHMCEDECVRTGNYGQRVCAQSVGPCLQRERAVSTISATKQSGHAVKAATMRGRDNDGM